MTPFQYIYQELQNISDAFPHIGIKYAYNSTIKTHIVEIAPETEFENNQRLDEMWIPVSMDFKEKFQDQDIAFIPPSSSLAIQFPECEFLPMVSEAGELEFFEELSSMALKYSFVKNFSSGCSFGPFELKINEAERIHTNDDDTTQFYDLAA